MYNRTQTEAPGALHERDEDESGPDGSPSSTCRDTLDPPMAAKNMRRLVHININLSSQANDT